MAIKVNGTTVVDDSRVLSNVTGLKTINSTSILGSGDIAVGASTTFGAVGTYCVGYGSNNTGYSTGDTIAGSAIGYDDGGSFNGGGMSKFLYSGGSSSSGSVAFGYYGYWSSLGLSGTWRAMTEGGAAAVGRIQGHLWCRVS
jgi:hypothetical protein